MRAPTIALTDYRLPLDEPLLRAVNGLGWSWLDAVWVAASSPLFGASVAVALGLWLFGSLKRKAIRPLLQAATAIAITDALGFLVLKPYFHRLRPPFALPKDGLRQLVEISATAGSMPSLHAANSFAFAVGLGLALTGSLRITLPVAVLISVSRVGVGVHWPSDALFGALYGAAVGLLVHRVFGRLAAAIRPAGSGWDR